MTTQIPLTLYIHIPWCVRKCPYCDFNSHAMKTDSLPEVKYISVLLNDLKQALPYVENRTIQSIFIGGGTPSLFSPNSIDKLLNELAKKLILKKDIEITLEANPGTVEQQRFVGFKKAGINRLSLGIQSFHPMHLKTLGRIHNDDEAKQAIKAARLAGFDNFNLDLMFGLPKQTIQEGIRDLQIALEFQPKHISWYQLTLEPNTLFYQKPPPLPNEEEIWQLQQKGWELLHTHGFKQYEISAYSLSHYQCVHNNNYWEFGDYLGIGAGAHAKITHADGSIHRYWKIKHPKEYLNQEKDYIAGTKEITSKELPLEFMLNALRLQKPISYSLFETRTGLPISTIQKTLQQAASHDLLILTNNHFQPSSKGYHFLNDLLEFFL